MAIKNYGSGSKEHTNACLDNGHQDPSLHPIGLTMCDQSQYQVNMINWSTVYTSPMRRNLETTIHMFKNHLNKDNIKFVVLPILREIMLAKDDIADDVNSLMNEFTYGKYRQYGINFDFSLLLANGNPQLW